MRGAGPAIRRGGAYRAGRLLPIMPAESLLCSGRHQAVLNQVQLWSGLPEKYYRAFYEVAINQFVEFVQVLPAEPTGALSDLMNGSLARAVTALQAYQLEAQDQADPLLSYAAFTAGLFQQVSAVLLNQRVILTDKSGNFGSLWNPFAGSMLESECDYYRFVPIASAYQRLDQGLRPILARQLLPSQGYHWIASDFQVLADWLDALNGDVSRGGKLAHMLAHLQNKEVLALHESLPSILVQQEISWAATIGEECYRWLRDRIGEGQGINTAAGGIYGVAEGLFIERRLFQEFAAERSELLSFATVYAQFCDFVGITRTKAGYDQYLSDYPQESRSVGFAGPLSDKKRALRDGLVVPHGVLLSGVKQLPEVTTRLRRMRRQPGDELPVLGESSSMNNAGPRRRPDSRST